MTVIQDTVIPRWEWRTFALTLDQLEAHIGAVARVSPRESDELYLLNLRGPHNAKIRGGVLDIKQLQEVNAGGLELWKPVFKAAFPLAAAGLRDAFTAWALPAPMVARDTYTLDQFLAEVAAPNPALRVAKVRKARRGFTFGGCTAEFAGVMVNGIACESFCLEHEDPSLILAALKELGLASQANINYPEGLKRALGLSREALAVT